jgi:HK97 family phage prohead protease
MPYFVSDSNPDCNGFAVEKADGEVMGCHVTKQDAIDQMVAISLSEGIEPGGERSVRDLPDNYRPALAPDVPDGRACGNCIFYNEERINEAGDKAWCERWEEFVDGAFYCNAWQGETEQRAVDTKPPAYMRASARRGLEFYEQGLGGDGLVDRTIREARQMAAGEELSLDKWKRIGPWIARHIGDLDAPAANPNSDDFPSAGVVAMALWGGGTTKRSALRAQAYAEGVVTRLEAEQERGMMKQETRNFDADFEVRAEGDGMTFVGYAAKFNSPSEDLGGFIETIEPGAFKRSLRARGNVMLLVNHDSGRVLASTRSGTMRLMEDSVGLRVEADLPNTTDGRDMAELLRRGDLSKMSFGFSVMKDSWNSDMTQRTLKSVKLFEASIVSFPAYTATEAMVRSLDKAAARAAVDADELADAVLKLEEGADLTEAEAELIKSVASSLSPAPVQVEEEQIPSLLDLKRKQLDLLLKRD